MNFSEIRTEVMNWTGRPDLTAHTDSAIRRSVLAAHRKEKFWRDLVTVVLAGLSPNTVQQVELAANFPRFRQAKLITNTDPALPAKYTIVDADDLWDNDGYSKTNIAFFAGTQLTVKARAQITGFSVQYYQDPIPTESGFASWIADQQPDLIIAMAAKTVLAFDNESEIYKAAAAQEVEEWAELVRNNIEGEGR